MRILVTGGFGYLGSSLASHLSNQGHKVSVASRNEQPFIKSLSKCDSRIINWNSDESIRQVCQDIDMVIHAAGMNANECLKEPILANNFNGDATKKILNKAISQGCKYFIYLSTAHVYNSNLNGLITEKTPLLNKHPYALSNIMGENTILEENIKGNIKGLVLRLSNIFGPPVAESINFRNLLIGDITHQAINSKKIKISSSGRQLRNFMTITELCKVFSFLIREIDKISKVHTLNVGSLWNTSILDAVTLVRDVISNKINKNIIIEAEKFEKDSNLLLDYSCQALYDFGYKPIDFIESEILNLAEFCLKLKKNHEH
jgi:UDP-glucose 4-epimerase